MPQVGEIDWHVAGDIGGIGVSRFRFIRQDAANIAGADCNAAAAASFALFNAIHTSIPLGVTWTCQAQVNVYDSASGLVQGPLVISSVPAVVSGGGSGSYGAGVGARVNWKTSTLAGRRLIKGALFVVPLYGGAFGSNGAVGSTLLSTLNTACATYLTAMTTASLYPVVWHRPKKGATVGGMTGIIFAGIAGSTPAGLRSRRS